MKQINSIIFSLKKFFMRDKENSFFSFFLIKLLQFDEYVLKEFVDSKHRIDAKVKNALE